MTLSIIVYAWSLYNTITNLSKSTNEQFSSHFFFWLTPYQHPVLGRACGNMGSDPCICQFCVVCTEHAHDQWLIRVLGSSNCYVCECRAKRRVWLSSTFAACWWLNWASPIAHAFLVACTRLYKPLCRSVGLSVTLYFFFAKRLIVSRVRDLWRSALFSIFLFLPLIYHYIIFISLM